MARTQTQTLEGIKGGGGSVKVGTTGTISSLMTRELEQQISSAPHKQVSSRTKPRTHLVSSSNNNPTPKRLQPRKSSDEASTSSSGSHRISGIAQKTKINGRHHSHRVPMLGSDGFVVDRSPRREKNEKKITNIVEVVDIKCGNPDKAWATPLANRLKKLSFSKLSETIN